MKSKTILEEIRNLRDEHAKQFNYDLDAIYADLKRRERLLKKQGWKIVETAPTPHHLKTSGK
jgi:hypothetical protein